MRTTLQDWGRVLSEGFSHKIDTPQDRRLSKLHTDWVDHGFLRYTWHSFFEVAPDVYRSNQPNPKRFGLYRDKGIRTVFNLRGATPHAVYKFEEEACTRLGLELINLKISARLPPTSEQLLQVLDVLDTAPRPMLIHCKSGADRTGLVAALHLIHVLGLPVEEAKKQLSWRYVHFAFSKKGILDAFLFQYARRLKEGPIALKDWISSEYDPDALRAEFDAMSFSRRLKL